MLKPITGLIEIRMLLKIMKRCSHIITFKLVNTLQKRYKKILEIGCGSGHRLNKICTSLIAEGFGLEPSTKQ